MDIFSKLDEIGEYIEQAKNIPMINQKMIDPEYLMRAFEELYAAIPEEIKEARQLIEKRDRELAEVRKQADDLLNRAKQECETMLVRAKEQAEKLLDESQIKKSAEYEAKDLLS